MGTAFQGHVPGVPKPPKINEHIIIYKAFPKEEVEICKEAYPSFLRFFEAYNAYFYERSAPREVKKPSKARWSLAKRMAAKNRPREEPFVKDPTGYGPKFFF